MTPTSPRPLRAAPNGVVLHRQIFLTLRDEIARGLFPSGMLPNEEALRARFGVSRVTVRRALADLAASGIVERRPALGTFIIERPTQEMPGPSLTILDSLRKTAMETRVQVIDVEHTEPPADIMRALRLQLGEKATHAVRLRNNRSGEPAMLVDAWVPGSLGQGATKTALKKHALYEILLQQGVQFGRVVQEFTSAMIINPAVATMLNTSVGSPVLKLVRLMHDLDEHPILHLTALMPAGRASVLMEIPGDLVNTLRAGQIVVDAPLPNTKENTRRK
ncbi:GntR family transcriptional regulator [Caballeronia sp. LP003]|uniref:GntR family transcriptional regulator n=1 Tax=Caballeronia sp. LP003 TaxID=3038551 RepID=UPI00286029CD|nr:GntR family transcriptional regulator [Caballeronia sp. LP003]MDR5785490.1 GntR family transcriptional regulator [Caballeronia sp. LP003]